MKFAFACLLLIACDNGGGGGTTGNLMPDAPPGTPLCTGVAYDWCAAPGDCASENCHFFEKSNFTVCTQTCSADNPCPPDKDGNPPECNNRGICKPAVANVCVLD